MVDLSKILGPRGRGDASEVARLLAECPYRDRAKLVADIIDRTGWSRNKVYALAQRGGWRSGRKTRSDKGATVLTEDEKLKLAKMAASTRRKGKGFIAPAEVLLDIAKENKIIEGDVSPATLNRYLRDMKMSKREMREAQDRPPTTHIATDRPNAEWQFDITVCTQFYLDKKGLKWRDSKMVYDNRVGLWKEIVSKPKLLRFVMIDHFSGAFFVRYYNRPGEHSMDVFDFLIRSMMPKFDPDRYPFRGVPVVLMADQGSALNSFLCLNFLDALGVSVQTHRQGNPNRKGAVEGHMWQWEQYFESRLMFEKITCLEEMNTLAEEYSARYCATKIHTRHGSTRSAKWSTIRNEQLVNLPDERICREIAQLKPETRDVRSDRTLPFLGETFFVADPDLVGKKVVVRRNPFNMDEVVAEHEGRRFVCQRIERDEHGFQVNAIRAASGDDQPVHSHPAHNTTMRTTKELPDLPRGIVGFRRGTDDFDGTVLGGRKRGEDLQVVAPAPKEYENTEARMRLLDLLGRSALEPAEIAHIESAWGALVTEGQIRAAVELFTQEKTHDRKQSEN